MWGKIFSIFSGYRPQLWSLKPLMTRRILRLGVQAPLVTFQVLIRPNCCIHATQLPKGQVLNPSNISFFLFSIFGSLLTSSSMSIKFHTKCPDNLHLLWLHIPSPCNLWPHACLTYGVVHALPYQHQTHTLLVLMAASQVGQGSSLDPVRIYQSKPCSIMRVIWNVWELRRFQILCRKNG